MKKLSHTSAFLRLFLWFLRISKSLVGSGCDKYCCCIMDVKIYRFLHVLLIKTPFGGGWKSVIPIFPRLLRRLCCEATKGEMKQTSITLWFTIIFCDICFWLLNLLQWTSRAIIPHIPRHSTPDKTRRIIIDESGCLPTNHNVLLWS